MSNFDCESLLVELEQTKSECYETLSNLKLIENVLTSHSQNSALVGDFRKCAIPMIYAVWERYFTSSISSCFRAIKDSGMKAQEHTTDVRAVWIQQQAFFSRYIDMIKNVYDIDAHRTISEKMSNMKKKIKKGHFALTSEVLDNIDTFNSNHLDKNVNSDDLVMTFSNVNKTVVEINMSVIGLNHGNIDLSMLDELVGIRNSLGHGQFMTSVGPKQLDSLIKYIHELIADLGVEVSSWLRNFEKSQINKRIGEYSTNKYKDPIISFRCI